MVKREVDTREVVTREVVTREVVIKRVVTAEWSQKKWLQEEWLQKFACRMRLDLVCLLYVKFSLIHVATFSNF